MINGEEYSRVDRFLHRLAFAGLGLQCDIADIEDTIYGARLEAIQLSAPVFVTSLPRAGTTLLLESLAKFDGFSSHTYRDMPFLLCPLLWNDISKPFHRVNKPQPRAHGDGMTITFDSVEAFEEILWKRFWPRHYSIDQIQLWHADDNVPDFEMFLKKHMRKIVALRNSGQSSGGRFLSKNNTNIARIGLLRALFPKSTILVPFRDPIEQATSLLRMHQRFLEIHAKSTFTRQYMNWLGHLEFGQLLKPIDFGGSIEPRTYDPQSIAYWLAYWIAAFEHLLKFREVVVFISYERFCAQPESTLQMIAATLGVAVPKDAATDVRAPIAMSDATLKVPTELQDRAHGLHRDLLLLAEN